MEHFRMDNTDGYTQSELDRLNELADTELGEITEEDDSDLYKHICETVLNKGF